MKICFKITICITLKKNKIFVTYTLKICTFIEGNIGVFFRNNMKSISLEIIVFEGLTKCEKYSSKDGCKMNFPYLCLCSLELSIKNFNIIGKKFDNQEK